MSDKNLDKPREKNGFIKWIDNFWYHNKAAVIIGFFALIVVVVCVTQLVSKKSPDVFIYYVGHGKLTEVASEEFKEDMKNYFAADYNGDGRVVVDYKEDAFVMVQDGDGDRYVYDPTAQMDETQRFNLELGMGDCAVYIMEPAFFNANTDYIADLSDVIGYIPENAISGKGMKLSDLKAYKNTALNRYPSDYVICMARKKSKFSDSYYEGNADFFKKLIEYDVNSSGE